MSKINKLVILGVDDGQVSQAESASPAKQRFTWNDLNDDGKISGDELPRRGRKRR